MTRTRADERGYRAVWRATMRVALQSDRKPFPPYCTLGESRTHHRLIPGDRGETDRQSQPALTP